MLDTNTIEIIKSTIPLLENAGTAVTEHFYKRLFAANPELKNIFNLSNQENGRQQFALFSAVASYAKYIDNLGELGSLVERIGQKHTSFYVQPEQYDVVGHHLIETLKELAPDDFTDDVADAWIKAYQFLATVLINREGDIYQDSVEQAGGWKGPRPFIVKDKIQESELVTSFILAPEDGGAIRPYKPGQYIAVKVKPDDVENENIRQYSLSDKYHPTHYRISVKREVNPEKGIVSNYLHHSVSVDDVIQLMPPAGAFYMSDTPKPVVLISAGVGITPMMSMLESILPTLAAGQKVLFLHACKNEDQHSFKNRVSNLALQYSSLKTLYWYSDTVTEAENTYSGSMDLNQIRDKIDLINAEVYLCGPVEFMRFVRLQLRINDVPKEQIHFETFGPHDEIT